MELGNISIESKDVIASSWWWKPSGSADWRAGSVSLINRQHVSHSCRETHWWIAVDTVRMEEWPSGKELHLCRPSGALDSRCWQAGRLLPPPSLHPTTRARWVMRKPGLGMHFNTGWDDSENHGTAAIIEEKEGRGTGGMGKVSSLDWVM